MNTAADVLDSAGQRLARALDALEGAVARRRGEDKSSLALRAEIQALSEDRSRLAQALDQAKARSARLETAAGHAAERLDSAMDGIRDIMQRQG